MVTITSPIAGVNRTVRINPTAGLSIDLPPTLTQNHEKGNTYVRVEADADISVTALTFAQGHTADGYLAIPSSRLGTFYLFTNEQNGILSFCALNDDTRLLLSVTAGNGFQYVNGTYAKSLSITLSSFNEYKIKSDVWFMGFVNSSSPVSLRYGSYLGSSTYSQFRSSYVEQAVQVNGSPLTFIVPMFSTFSHQIVICLSSSTMQIQTDHTDNYRSGSYTFIQKFRSAKYITTNQKASCTYDGHGFSTIIPPTQSYTNFYRFLTPSLPNFTHHAAIMILSSEKGDIRLDNLSPNAREETVSVDSQLYSVLYLNVTSGQHDITHVKPSINFGAILYGFKVGGVGTYAYPAGMKIN